MKKMLGILSSIGFAATFTSGAYATRAKREPVCNTSNIGEIFYSENLTAVRVCKSAGWYTVDMESLRGPAGPKGEKGDKGAIGPTGLPGSQGEKGEIGPVGPSGDVGPRGLPGPAGEIGPQGPTGPYGVTGPEGPQGPQGETGPAGASAASTPGLSIIKARLSPLAKASVKFATSIPDMELMSNRSLNFNKSIPGSTVKFVLSEQLYQGQGAGLYVSMFYFTLSIDGGNCDMNRLITDEGGYLYAEIMLPNLSEGTHNVTICGQTWNAGAFAGGPGTFMEIVEITPL